MKRYIELEDIITLDYIVISHAHFDHLPGADRLALKTGATVIANCEAINCLRRAGVPETQLIAVSGGERVPLFTRDILIKASEGSIELAPGPPLAPRKPHVRSASVAVHVWPSLHSLMPGTSPQDIPEVFDTNVSYRKDDDGYACALDITQLMQHGLFRLKEFMPEDHLDPGTRAFADYVQDRKTNIMSHCDGGQLMYNFIIGDKAVLFNTHLGAYEGVMRFLEPKPDVAILGAGGVANLNGRPFVQSAAEFLKLQTQWLHEPSQIFFCLHDESIIKPYKSDVTAAKKAIEQHTSSKVLVPELATSYVLFREQN
ncbi:uncharacterized protein yc1106_02135 [Curvularia clavata]|uniref:Metallo-beta-lactamase domain-containing protein n=1 Tax=Curvularia clavata TaxID=95742 RepID=A0A9Q8Z298_CURCL|nr:uncharacterized protein yc1106_02135 [Curvularia clavata]